MKFDQIVIGNGSEAINAARQAARAGQRVALVSDPAGANSIDNAVLRRAAECLVRSGTVTMAALRREVAREVDAQQAADDAELDSLGVVVLHGDHRFVDANTVFVADEVVEGNSIVLACGTKSAQLGQSPFNGRNVFSVEDFLKLDELPQSMLVVGAGRRGLDHAVVLAMLGVEVTIVDEHFSLFDLCGGLMGASLFEAQALDIVLRLGDEVIGLEEKSHQVAARLASGRALVADAVLICTGRVGRTDSLDLESAGVGVDEHGRVWCDAQGRTWAPNITAIGDVVGFRASRTLAMTL
ncbi:MAG: FAD-dependent oxidoreductase [Planctomycetes bacterium]|nr:FAD-dependent oxidoreductase [Planctomycetota bacterium]